LQGGVAPNSKPTAYTAQGAVKKPRETSRDNKRERARTFHLAFGRAFLVANAATTEKSVH